MAEPKSNLLRSDPTLLKATNVVYGPSVLNEIRVIPYAQEQTPELPERDRERHSNQAWILLRPIHQEGGLSAVVFGRLPLRGNSNISMIACPLSRHAPSGRVTRI